MEEIAGPGVPGGKKHFGNRHLGDQDDVFKHNAWLVKYIVRD